MSKPDDRAKKKKHAAADKTAEKAAEKAVDTAESAAETAAAAGADAAKTEAAPDALKAAEEKIAELEKENADLKNQLLYRAADFDNYRKRMLKEKQEAYDFANTSLLQDLLDSIDNFDRTLDAGKTATDVKTIVDGIAMINRQLMSMLETKYNLVAYGAAGDAFNPDEHEAIASEQGPVADPVLKTVYLKGYKLKDRVIRHAKVMVTMPDGSVQQDAAGDGKNT